MRLFRRKKFVPQRQDISCRCGTFQGYVSVEGIQTATRVTCFCADCRAAELYLSQPDPRPNGVDLLHITPDSLTVTQGHEQLQVMRLSPKGLMRWHTSCCNTPVASTLAKPGLPVCALRLSVCTAPDMLGPVRTRSFVPQPNGPPRTIGALTFVVALFSRMMSARLSGRWKTNPFFDVENARPVRTPTVISKAERAQLTR